MLLAGLQLLSGCDSQNYSCTQLGALSGVRFDVDAWAARHLTAAEATACVQDVCATVEITHPMLLFVKGEFDGPGTAHVKLTIRDASRRVLFDAQASVPLSIRQPNGPKCEPTVWQAVVSPGANGRLVPDPGR